MDLGGQLHVPVCSPLRRKPPSPIKQETLWATEPVWAVWRKETLIISVRTRTLYRSALSLGTVPTELLWVYFSVIYTAVRRRFVETITSKLTLHEITVSVTGK